jgi:hypothetical protein
MNESAFTNRQRVSCAGLCRIKDGHGRYLLGLNRNRMEQGKSIYMPLGGALCYFAPDLLARFDAVPEDATSNDLRLFIDAGYLEEFRQWFLGREEREVSPYRELHEELVDEFAFLPALSPNDIVYSYARTVERVTTTLRSGVNGVMTHYFHDIYDVAFLSPDVREILERAPLASGLRWFSNAEILRGTADDGALILADTLLPALT